MVVVSAWLCPADFWSTTGCDAASPCEAGKAMTTLSIQQGLPNPFEKKKDPFFGEIGGRKRGKGERQKP